MVPEHYNSPWVTDFGSTPLLFIYARLMSFKAQATAALLSARSLLRKLHL